MEIRPIRTEADYEVALRRIEALWGASAGSPDADELDVLVTLTEAYEREHYPTDPPEPAHRLASLGGTMPELNGIPRRRERSK